MKEQKLLSETLVGLKEIPVGHPYNNFVRISRPDAQQFLADGQRVLCLRGARAYWVNDTTLTGKYFVYWA